VEKMYEIIFHGRGGQGALLAARILANAYFFDGKHIEAFPHFSAERRGAPVRAYLRVTSNPIRSKVPILSADCAIVLDASLLDYVDITQGLKENSLIILNTPLKPEEIKLRSKYKLATCDASAISLKVIGKDIPNSAMLGAFSHAASLSMEALTKGFKEVFANKAQAEKNIEMAKAAVDATSMGFSSVETKAQEKKSLEASGSEIEIGGTYKADGSSRQNITSSWTTQKAIIDQDKCNFCLFCYTLCPEGCILREEKELKIEYDYCKGCGICEKVCPPKAISMQRKEI
jgi:2-oxoacid:acceptor oxidoreductase gamma subunit (pyruvate/2-ketoisovalerate family)/2-oxoacid:acceptor oxidoreductase delta subunit (pyruvate/2-ketoisovalerate family)